MPAVRRNEAERGAAHQDKAGGHKGVGDMQDKDEPVGKRALACPAGEPDELHDAPRDQSGSCSGCVGRRDPEQQG